METNYQQSLETLLELVIQNGASDLHLGEGRHPFIRTNGELTAIVQYPALSKDDMPRYRWFSATAVQCQTSE